MADTTDRLTGLLADDFLRRELDLECERARRFGRELAFVLVEPAVDDAVRADMTYLVLKTVAREAGLKVRDIDKSVRWGQQVLLLLPETGRAGAETVLQKIVESFGRIVFKHPEDGRVIPVALKTSVLVFPHDGTEKETILYNLREGLQLAPGSQTAAPSA